MASLLLVLAAAALASGCVEPAGPSRCRADGDCPSGYVCDAVRQVCRSTEIPLPDGAALDLAAPDAATGDRPAADAALRDLGAADVQTADAPPTDVAPADRAAADAQASEAGRSDAAAPDLEVGEAAAFDAVAPDLGVDAAPTDGSGDGSPADALQERAPGDAAEDALCSDPALTNLVRNPDFEEGTTAWSFYTEGLGDFSTTSPAPSGQLAAHIEIAVPSSNVQLYQTSISLQAGLRYRLCFWARSSSGHDLSVTVHKHGAPYTTYGLGLTRVDLTETWQRFMLEFTATGFSGTVSDARLRFWFAPYDAADDVFEVDGVLLAQLPD